MKKLLHVGCGPLDKRGLKGFNNDNWQEIRFDIDMSVNPDVVGTLTNMEAVASESVDAVYSSHNIEHVFPHEVPAVLKEFHRVLSPQGFVVITCPDLQSVCKAVADNRLLEPLYQSSMGPISPLDILYGHRESLAMGNAYMAHKTGFTYAVLTDFFCQAGFQVRIGGQRPEAFDLWLIAFKSDMPQDAAYEIANRFLP